MKALRNTCVIASIALGGLASQAGAQTYTVAVNPQGSLYYTVGSAIAATLENTLETRTIVQPYTGSSVYLPLLSTGEATLAIAGSLEVARAYNDPENPIKDLRVVGRLWGIPYGYFVRADSGMTTVSDLKGSRVVSEFRTHLSLNPNNLAILAAGGLEEGDYEAITVGSVLDGVALLTDGSVDATPTIPGAPQSQQAHATISGGIRYLDIAGEHATEEVLTSVSPGSAFVQVEPRPSRPSITEEITLTGIEQFLVVGADQSDEDVTKILTAIWDSWSRLQEDVPALRDGTVEQMAPAGTGAPYHPAAAAFYRDRGLWTDAHDNHEREQFGQ